MVMNSVPLNLKVAQLQFEIDNDKEKVVESAISEVKGKDETSLLLPLAVHFKDNESWGVDAGGPMKVNLITLSQDRNYYRKINRRHF